MRERRGIAWVTGAAGFLGSHVANRLVQDGWTVCGIGHQSTHPDSLARSRIAGWRVSDVDQAGLSALLDMSGGAPDLVFHAAGGASVGRSVDDPSEDRARTVDATAALLRCLCSAAPSAHLILPSSAAVYGEFGSVAVGEDHPRAPVSPYGEHKALCEDLCEAAHRETGLPVTVVRFFSLYGSGLRKQLLWDLCGQLNKLKGEVTLFGSGEESRDWMHVSDAAALISLLAGAPAGWRVLNGGTGVTTCVRDVAELVTTLMAGRGTLHFNHQRRPGDPAHLVADIGALTATGFRHNVSLPDGASEYVTWYRNVESAGGPAAVFSDARS